MAPLFFLALLLVAFIATAIVENIEDKRSK